jgi:putative transposase
MGGDPSDARRREELVTKVSEVGEHLGIAATCAAVGLPRATYYRQRGRPSPKPSPRRAPPRKLSAAEREQVLAVLHEERFADWHRPRCKHSSSTRAPTCAQLEPCIASSPRTLNFANDATSFGIRATRSSAAPGDKAERTMELGHHEAARSEEVDLLLSLRRVGRISVATPLAGCSPNANGENSPSSSCARHASGRASSPISSRCTAIGAAPMKSKTLAQLYADLGVTKTHSRPHTSNDNPFSESQFKTMKYRPEFPKRFASQEHARDCVARPSRLVQSTSTTTARIEPSSRLTTCIMA